MPKVVENLIGKRYEHDDWDGEKAFPFYTEWAVDISDACCLEEGEKALLLYATLLYGQVVYVKQLGNGIEANPDYKRAIQLSYANGEPTKISAKDQVIVDFAERFGISPTILFQLIQEHKQYPRPKKQQKKEKGNALV